LRLQGLGCCIVIVDYSWPRLDLTMSIKGAANFLNGRVGRAEQ